MTTYTESSLTFERVRLRYHQLQQRISGRAKTVFFVAVILAASGLLSPPMALAMGVHL
jgi:hypothetical protein